MEEKKRNDNVDERYGKKEEKKRMEEGIFISKRNLRLFAGGALGALAAIGIGKVSKRIRPTIVGAVKEGYAFKEWAAGKLETAKEDVEDIIAEAKHAYYKDIEATEKAIKKEKEILEDIEKIVKKKAKKINIQEESE